MGKDTVLFYSTAGQFIDALKAENQTWPLSVSDFSDTFGEQGKPLDVLSGGYSSRPNLKNLIKDASAVNFATQRLLA